MPSDKIVRWSAVAFAIFFTVVVALGYIPGLNVKPHVHNPEAMSAMPMPAAPMAGMPMATAPTPNALAEGEPMAADEHMMLGLYKISLIDDVTHGLSALAFLLGALLSARVSRLALTAFGWYYAYDATIYLVTGVLQQKPFMQNFGLNAPHVVISGIMLWLAYRGRTNVPSASL